ncbi:MAG: glycosyltransferase family 39 protein [Chloroflexi bacterium]|nr:glycosyltransferase family 39 protein [Chloroflexota bacterium]
MSRPIVWIVAAFLVLGTLYSVVTPLFEAPDEIWHFTYIDWLADGNELPVFSSEAPQTELRAALHPPLYYWLTAALVAPIDRSDFPGFVRFNLANPAITPGASSDRPNLFIHTPHEDFPYRGAVLAAHLARWVSVLLGALTVLGVYAVVRQVVPNQPALAWGAAGLVGFTPQFIFMHGTINNDALAAATATWTLYGAMRWTERNDPRWAIFLGLVSGAGLLAKLGGFLQLGLVLLAIALQAWRTRRWQIAVRDALLSGGVALLTGGWWYLRNGLLYGDPLTWELWLLHIGGARPTPTLAQLFSDAIGLWSTYWADFNIPQSHALGLGLGLLSLAVLMGLMRRTMSREWREVNRSAATLATFWLALILALAGRYALITFEIEGRLLYPAAAPIGLLLAAGILTWTPRALAAAAAGLAAISLAAPFALIHPAYAPPLLAAQQLPPEATPTSVRFGEALELIGYQVGAARVEPGHPLPITTSWRALDAIDEDARAVVVLTRPDGVPVGQAEAILGSRVYPTTVWRSGPIVVAEITPLVAASTDTPTLARVMLHVRGESAETWAVHPALGSAGDRVSLGEVRLAWPGARCAASSPASFQLGEAIYLEGFAIEPIRAEPEEMIWVRLCWRVVSQPGRDYTVFVHLLDSAGALVATGDGPPRGGNYPTSRWSAGEELQDMHGLRVPAQARPGTYTLSVGLYEANSGIRLPAFDGRGAHLPVDEIPLGTIFVSP